MEQKPFFKETPIQAQIRTSITYGKPCEVRKLFKEELSMTERQIIFGENELFETPIGVGSTFR